MSSCRLLARRATFVLVMSGLSLICINVIAADPDPTPAERVRLKTSMGDIVLELDRAKAPITVENFLKYVETGFYDDTIFHRVVKDFMVQGGGRTADLSEKKTGRPIRNEASNGLSNLKYTVAMARKDGDAHSATVQFFINTSDKNTFLDRQNARDGVGYTVFAKVIVGKDVVDEISGVPTAAKRDPQFKMLEMDDVPITPVTILAATVMDPDEKIAVEKDDDAEKDSSEEGDSADDSESDEAADESINTEDDEANSPDAE